MKPIFLTVFCFLLSGLDNVEAHPGLTINFFEPEHFKDVALSGSTTDKIRSHVLVELEKYMQHLADARLPQRHRLNITVSDIDMAGEFEPWRAPTLMNTRIIRDIYRPSIKLHYQWLDEQGNTLADKDESVAELNYLRLANPGLLDNDPLRYEKAMLRRWFEKTILTSNNK